MEKKLKKLFDYQRFEKNERLEKIIKETESRYATELSDDDLSLVNAAGETGGSIGGLIGDFPDFWADSSQSTEKQTAYSVLAFGLCCSKNKKTKKHDG